ncbi:MAG TPA: hypothetical protein VK614_02325 [Allosphingosinicella sp.]|nr:hypothetical protein [Allosphingosinicella sp.]
MMEAKRGSVMKRYDREMTSEEMKAISDADIDFSDIPEADATFWKQAQQSRPRETK